jgi:predicted transcriptional regulator of viral defense system
MRGQLTQRERLRQIISDRPIVRASELRREGIAAETISRALYDGEIDRIGRGLYQQPGSDIDAAHTLAEAAKKIPKGVIAMTSALAFHGLTDQIPRKVWVAIGKTDWEPVKSYPPTRIIRFDDKYLRAGIEIHKISGVDVPIYSVPKTLADLFRNPRLVDRSIAIEGLRAALDQHKGPVGEIADAARAGGAWKVMRPYLEALTANG